MAIGRPISLTPNIATKAINSVATANQTEFTVTGGYRINELAVYRNGVRLAQGRDFTASDGTTVTLTNGATLNDVIEFVIFDSFNVAGTIVSAASSQTLSGDLNVTGKLYGGAVDTDSLNIGVGTFVSAIHVGTALTANAAGDVQSIGIITAASFSGDGSALTGLANTDFVVSVATTTGNLNVSAAATITGALTGSTGTFSGAVSGTTGTFSAAVSGTTGTFSGAVSGTTGTFSAAVSGTTGTFSGAVNVDDTTDSTSATSGALIVDGGLGVAKNVYIGAGLSVAGTLTYEDVTNVDSVGLITAKSGVNVTGGQLTVGSGITMGIAGVATFSGTADVHLHDNVKLNVGDGSDLKIFHDGSHSYVQDSGTGDLLIDGSIVKLRNAGGTKNYAVATDGSSIDLYFNNSKKFETTNDGTVTTGIATATLGIDAAISVWTLGADGSNHYTFTGPGNLSATNDPTLNLIRGQKYTFKNRSGGHPFRIQSTANGSAGTAYNTGVTNNDGGNGTNILFDVPHDAPSILYYQCTSHGSMGGAMYISGSAYEIKIGSNITLGTAGIVTAAGGSFTGSVGINSTSPSASEKLCIRGGASDSGKFTFHSYADFLGASDAYLGHSIIARGAKASNSGSQWTGIGATTSYGWINFAANSASQISITSTKVGIGTINPTRGPLHIHEQSTGDCAIHLTNAETGSTSSDGFTIFTGGDAGPDAGCVNRESGGAIEIYTNNGSAIAERLRVAPAGDLNLGATGNYNDITGTGGGLLIGPGTGKNAGLMLRSDSDGFGRIYFGDNSGSAAQRHDGYIVYSQTDRNLSVGTATTTRITVGSAGQIGVAGANYGSSGQVLTSGGSGSAPSWADAGGGAWEFISAIENPNTSTVAFTGLSTSNTAAYKVVWSGANINSTNNRKMRCRIYLDSSLQTGSDYQDLSMFMELGSGTVNGSQGQRDAINLSGQINPSKGYNGELTFPLKQRESGGTESLQAFYGHCVSENYANTIQGYHTNSYSSILNGIAFDSPDNYNVTDGLFTLYRLTRS